jgi:hypothetical protein
MTWYEQYCNDIKEGASKLKSLKEIPQHILWLKAFASEKLENDKVENCFEEALIYNYDTKE